MPELFQTFSPRIRDGYRTIGLFPYPLLLVTEVFIPVVYA